MAFFQNCSIAFHRFHIQSASGVDSQIHESLQKQRCVVDVLDLFKKWCHSGSFSIAR